MRYTRKQLFNGTDVSSLYKKGANQHVKKLRHPLNIFPGTWHFIIFAIAIAALLALFLKLTEPKIISPLSDNPLVHTVYAAEPKRYEKEEIVQIIKTISGSSWWTLVNIARCESGIRQDAIGKNTNGSLDVGVLQVNVKAHYKRLKGNTETEKVMNLRDPVYNVTFAYMLFLEQGEQPWDSSRSCWEASK